MAEENDVRGCSEATEALSDNLIKFILMMFIQWCVELENLTAY